MMHSSTPSGQLPTVNRQLLIANRFANYHETEFCLAFHLCAPDLPALFAIDGLVLRLWASGCAIPLESPNLPAVRLAEPKCRSTIAVLALRCNRQ